MSTSASRVWFSVARRYGAAAVGAAIFSTVYELCSHGVYSLFMLGLAAWPLMLGALPALIAGLAGMRGPTPAARTLAAMATLTLTMGSLVAGVMEIYGSTSAFTRVYWAVGGALALLAVVVAARGMRHPRHARRIRRLREAV